MARYIDADKIPYFHYSSDETAIEGVEYTLKGVIKNRVPTEDVAPVVHSSWEEIKDDPHGIFDYHFKCNKCHGETPQKAYLIAPDYCPICGAKMDGKDNDSNE